ncbi:MAG: hypothetical protein FJY92_00400 [Candidatus Hydrogenedentes bacterium]|nr:hypothetical protein [Candidatus Hydrogenedentota bacterium]
MSTSNSAGNGAPDAGPPARLASVDALRGFDMFWIIGGREVLLAVVALVAYPAPAWLEFQLEHPPWELHTFAAWDLIMPLFLFVSGVALPFSMSKWSAPGRMKFYARLVRRLVILWVLGMAVQGNLFEWDLAKLRLYSNTLQAIAAGYLIATIVLMAFPRRGQIAATAALFIGYWALLEFVSYTGHAAGVIEPANNVAKHVDQLVLGRFSDNWHYTWVLSSLGFGGTVMMGAFAGMVLKAGRPARNTIGTLAVLAAACLAVGWVWGYQHPFNKYIWSSSMNLWACGWCFALLAVFYWAVDVKGMRALAFPLIVIGANAIAVYTATHLFDFGTISGIFLDHLTPRLGRAGALLDTAGALLVPWLILLYLWRKKTFIRL